MRTACRRAASTMVMIVMSLAVGSPSEARDPRGSGPGAGAEPRVMRLTSDEITWTSGPAMLPPGARMAVIDGAFDRPGPFTVRLKFPADYRIPAHWHPVKVTVTVISGTFHMGLGDMLDTSQGKTLPAGSIFEMPATIHHFGWTSEETIIQEHGIGPLSVHYLSPGAEGSHR